MRFLLAKQVRSRFQLFFSELDDWAAEVLNALVDVLLCENHARSWSECINLSSSVPQSGQERLHWFNLIRDVKVHRGVNFVIESGGKLLEWVNMELDLGNWLCKASAESSNFTVKSLDWSSGDMLLNLVS